MDADAGSNGDVRYELMFGTDGADKLFKVHADTGEIHTKLPMIQANGRSFILSIRAVDQPQGALLSRYPPYLFKVFY